MKIKNINICNWRSIKNTVLSANDLMIIIGQNNHGKSNLLSSILFFFGEIKAQNLDFHLGSKELYVEVEFYELDQQDKITFKKYLTKENTIKVRKTAYYNGSFEYQGWIETCNDDFLKEENASAYTKREVAMSLPFYKYLPHNGRISKQDIINAQLKYIEEERENVSFEYILENNNFLGLKSVSKGIFGEVYFLPALKNANEDFSSKDSSIFSNLLSEMINLMSDSNPEWMKSKEQLSSLFSSFNKYIDGKENNNRPIQLTDLEAALSNELKPWNAEFDIEILTPDIESIFKTSASVQINDGARTDISHKGHGLQRAVTIALIQLLAKKQIAKKTEQPLSNRSSSKSRFFIFEEPELYLHPQAQRALFDSLVYLSESGNQVILCTHSSGLIDINQYKSIYIIKKENNHLGSQVTQCNEDLFDGNDRDNWNLSYWINPDRSELFFAEKVILVEGPTEKAIIPALAKRINTFKYTHTIIDCASKDNIPLYMKLLNKFGIPYIAIYDKDHQNKKNQDAKNNADKSSARIENELNCDLGSTVILINDIEEELGYESGNSGKPFEALKYINSPNFILTKELEDKIKKIYQ